MHDLIINTLGPRQNERLFTDDIFKCIFLNDDVWIPNKISLKFVPKGPINNIPALVQIMAWHRPGDKPLSEPMLVSLTTHVCVTRPQWVNICSMSQPHLISRRHEYILLCKTACGLVCCDSNFIHPPHESQCFTVNSDNLVMLRPCTPYTSGDKLRIWSMVHIHFISGEWNSCASNIRNV